MSLNSKHVAFFDILLLVSLVFIESFPEFLNFNYFDDILAFYFLVIMVFKFHRFLITINMLNSFIFLYLIYSVLLCVFLFLPLSSYVQIFITSKFLIFFLYFCFQQSSYKDYFYRYFVRLIVFIFFTSLIISFVQFAVPSMFPSDYRGLNGITLLGLFQSRTLYSSFLVLVLIYLTNVNQFELFNNKFSLIRNKNYYIILIIALILLTFTRKDLVFSFGYFIYTYSRDKGRYKYFLRFVSLVLILLSPFISDYFFNDINNMTFVDDQIRSEILSSGVLVFENYFPFGSGPGTFGSIMSMQYQNVYIELNIPERIYLGYQDGSRGPIFDVFIISLLAEYGIGIVFFFLLYFSILRSSNQVSILPYINTQSFKLHSLIYIILMSLTVPILNNLIGLLFFSFFGILTSRKQIVQYS